MRLEQLEYLVALKKYGSMSIASEKLHITKQTLSAAIKNLEEELTHPLFLRTPKGVSLTDLGEQVYEKALNILFLTDEINQLCFPNLPQSVHQSLTGTIKLAATPAALQNILWASINHFYKHNPNLTIIAEDFAHTQVIQKLDDEAYDLGFMSLSQTYLDTHRAQLFGDRYQLETITAGRLHLLVGASCGLVQQKNVSLKSVLQHYTLACAQADQLKFLSIDTLLQAHHITPKIFHCSNIEIVHDNVLNNQSIAFSASSAWHLMKCHRKDELIRLPLKDHIPVVTIAIIPKNRPLSKEAKAFLDVIKELVKAVD